MASLALVAVGGVVSLLIWCIASPWTFALAVAAACWARGSAGRTASTQVGRWLRGRLAEVPLVGIGHGQLLRLLPTVALAAVGWSILLGAAGAALLLVDAAFGRYAREATDFAGGRRLSTSERVERARP